MRIYLMLGAPGHGKSAVAQMIADRTGAVTIEADVVRKNVVADGNPTYSGDESSETYARLHQAAYWITQSRDVVLDATFNLTVGRERASEVAKATDSDLELVHVECDAQTAKDRIKARDGVSDAGVEYYESFEMDEITRDYATIDNSGDLTQTRQQVADLVEL